MPSSWQNWPTKYKFIGTEILLSFDVMHTSRTTYDLLALAGDIGGLNEVLNWISVVLVSKFAWNNGTWTLA